MLQARSWLPRTEGSVRLGMERVGEGTRLKVLHQAGAGRVRFPRPQTLDEPEAVLINTAGGLTGGDRIDIQVSLGAAARATVSTAAAEKIYRSSEGEAMIRVALQAGETASLCWLPQPTILFDRARLERSTDVELTESASLLAVETILFGRTAMGEDVTQGHCRDAWRVRRAGRLIFAEAFYAAGALASVLNRPAALEGGRATSMLLYVAPDAAVRIDEVRALLGNAQVTAGASTWNGLLILRAVAQDGRALQQMLVPIIQCLSGGRPLPKVWHC